MLTVTVDRLEGYVAPKKQYSFEAMLGDILEFAAHTLVINGRISLWMPTANEDDVEIDVPSNPYLELVSICIQPFNKCTLSSTPCVLQPR